MILTRTTALLTAGILLAASEGLAQHWTRYYAAGFIGVTERGSENRFGQLNRTGATFGFEGGVAFGNFLIDARYHQGNLSADGAARQDFAEGELLVGLRPVPWLVLKAGPQARSFESAGTRERWFFMQGHVRGQTQVFEPVSRTLSLHTYVELWLTLGADVNIPDPFDSGRGFEGGLVLLARDAPVSARVAYRVDRENFGGGTRRETVQELLIVFGLAR